MAQKILIIDDSATIRKLVSALLTNAGYEVVEADDGQKGLEVMSREKIDLVLSDQNMPTMDGLTFVSKIREQDDCKNIPILLLTTESGDQLKLRGKNAGATGWLVKPLNPVQLLNVVKRLLG